MQASRENGLNSLPGKMVIADVHALRLMPWLIMVRLIHFAFAEECFGRTEFNLQEFCRAMAKM